MLSKGPSCPGCPLEHAGVGFMAPTGTGHNGVLLCAESLGSNEAEKGVPLIGPAGFTLGRALQRGGFRREDFTLANVVWCQPPSNDLLGTPYEHAAVSHCTPYISKLIRDLQRSYPRAVTVPAKTHPDGSLREAARHYKPNELVVVALGEVPLRRFTDFAGITDCRGYVFWNTEFNCWVVPTFHPSYIMRGNVNLNGFLIEDIAKALRIAEEGFSHEIVEPLLDPPAEEFQRWVGRYATALQQNPLVPLAVDIETPRKKGRREDDLAGDDDATYTILRIGFAFGPHGPDAVSIPWSAEYRPLVDRLLGSFGRKLIWYRPYDLPRLLANGCPVRGVVEDAMDAWHVLQSDLPRGLADVTPTYCPRLPMWKHLSSREPAFYNAIDALVLWRNYRGICEDLARL